MGLTEENIEIFYTHSDHSPEGATTLFSMGKFDWWCRLSNNAAFILENEPTHWPIMQERKSSDPNTQILPGLSQHQKYV